MQFAFDNFKNHNIVVVNGYFPSLSVKRLLKTIIEGGLGCDASFRSVLDQVCILDPFVLTPTHEVPLHAPTTVLSTVHIHISVCCLSHAHARNDINFNPRSRAG